MSTTNQPTPAPDMEPHFAAVEAAGAVLRDALRAALDAIPADDYLAGLRGQIQQCETHTRHAVDLAGARGILAEIARPKGPAVAIAYRGGGAGTAELSRLTGSSFVMRDGTSYGRKTGRRPDWRERAGGGGARGGVAMTSILDAMLAESKRRRALAEALAEGPHAFADLRRPAWHHLVSLDPSKPGRWRATRFEGEEPVGHVEAMTFAGAVRAAVESGADVETARAVGSHPPDSPACDPDAPCDECAAAYAEPWGEEMGVEAGPGDAEDEGERLFVPLGLLDGAGG